MKNLKQKVALLLALVMMFALVPTNVFGRGIMDYRPVRTVGETATQDLYGFTVTFPFTADMRPGAAVSDTVILPGGVSIPSVGLRIVASGDGAENTIIRDVNVVGVGITTGASLILNEPGAGGFDGGARDVTMPVLGALTAPAGAQGGVMVNWITVTFNATTAHHNTNFSMFWDVVRSETPSIISDRITLIDNQRLTTNVGVRNGYAITAGTVQPFRQQHAAGPQTIAHINLQEREIGNFLRHGGTVVVELLAPANYFWANTAPSLVGTGAFAGETVAPSTPFNRLPDGGIDNRLARIEVSAADVEAMRGFGGLGTLSIQGLQLQPIAGFTPFAADLNVRVRVLSGTSGGLGSNVEHFSVGSLLVARQELIGVTPSRYGDPVDIRTGQTAGTWSAPILIHEDGIHSFLDQVSLSARTANPGVEIMGARVRVFNFGTAVGGSGRGDGAWVSMNDFISITRDRVDFHTVTGAGGTNRRTIELQLQLRSLPNYVGRDVNTQVEIDVYGVVSTRAELNVSRRVHVANLFDPIFLTADAPVNIPFGVHAIGVALNSTLANVTMEETAAGRLAQGSRLDVYLIPTYRGLPLHLGLGIAGLAGSAVFSTAATQVVGGNGVLTCANNSGLRLRAVPNSPNLEMPTGALGGVSFIVEQASNNGAGAIDFVNNMLFGAMWNMPGIAIDMVFGGPAVENFSLEDAPMPYNITVATLYDQAPPVGDDTRRPEQGPGQIVVPRPDNYVGTFSQFDMVEGQPAVIGSGATAALSLRFFANLIPGSTLDFEGGYAIINAVGADGNNRTITMSAAAGTNSATVSTAGGEPRSVLVGAAFNQDGRLFVPISAIPNLFGFSLFPDGATWLIVPAA